MVKKIVYYNIEIELKYFWICKKVNYKGYYVLCSYNVEIYMFFVCGIWNNFLYCWFNCFL